jgi:MtfA peptidase
MVFSWLRRRRRERILATPFPTAWLTYLDVNVPHYALLNWTDQARLRDDLRVFVAEKNWEGCAGLTVTDEMKVTIAAQACLMALGLEREPFRGVLSILIYPDNYLARREPRYLGSPEWMIVNTAPRRLAGQAMYRGPVILSWEDVLESSRNLGQGSNVVWHEFAHQLDMLDRSTNGTPPLETPAERQRWFHVMMAEYQQLIDDVSEGRETLLDPYGRQNETEFFAVVTECFFDQSVAMRDRHPELYKLLSDYFHQDPAARMPR